MTGIYQNGSQPPAPRAFNMAAYVLRRAEVIADKTALEIVGPAGQSHRWSYGSILSLVRQTAGGLRARGLEPGDKVLMRLGNSIEFPIVYLGALWAGLVPVPTSASLTQPEVDWIAADLGPRLCVGQAPLPCPGTIPTVAPETLHGDAVCAAPDLGSPDRLAYVIYTSGSTGRPRAVAHAHRAIWARRMMYDGWYGLGETDRMFHAGAFNWTYTLGTGLMDPWAQGATALIRAEGVEIAGLADVLRDSGATIFAAVPGVYRQMLKPGGVLPLPRLRHGLSAGEALSARLRQAWRRATETEIYEALGMSECSTYISACPARQAPDGVAGFVQDGRRVTVLDTAGTPQPFGTPGTLGIDRRDPGLMLGYLGDDAATRARMKGDWFDTGDRAVLQADGSVRFLGRDDDMMNAGGFRVSPLEVEAAFATLPGLAECAAVEVEIKADARVIALFHTGKALDHAMLQAHAADRLADYKRPRLYIHLPALPHNPNGKLNRKALRSEFEARK